MSVPCPPMEWPSTLEEAGPAEDPTIVLAGAAQIGGTPFRVTAIRVEPRLRSMPDYRPGLDPIVYECDVLERLLDDLGEVANTDHPRTIELSAGAYVMYMTSAP